MRKGSLYGLSLISCLLLLSLSITCAMADGPITSDPDYQAFVNQPPGPPPSEFFPEQPQMDPPDVDQQPPSSSGNLIEEVIGLIKSLTQRKEPSQNYIPPADSYDQNQYVDQIQPDPQYGNAQVEQPPPSTMQYDNAQVEQPHRRHWRNGNRGARVEQPPNAARVEQYNQR